MKVIINKNLEQYKNNHIFKNTNSDGIKEIDFQNLCYSVITNNSTDGITGPKGDIGPSGLKGNKGNIGLTGSIGPQGDIGPIGPSGLKGNQGIQGEVGLQGEVGPIGIKGEQGKIGLSGIDGKTGLRGPKCNGIHEYLILNNNSIAEILNKATTFLYKKIIPFKYTIFNIDKNNNIVKYKFYKVNNEINYKTEILIKI